MKSLEEIKEYFKADVFATKTGIEIVEVNESFALCSLLINANHLNALNQIMGGVLFTIGDFTAAVSLNYDDEKFVSISSDIKFLNRLKGKTIFAKSSCQKKGNKIAFIEVSIYDDLGTNVALFSTTNMKI